MKTKQQTTNGLKVPENTSLVLCTTSCAKADDKSLSKPVSHPRREKTCDRQGRISTQSDHSVFVLSKDGKALTPTTPARARKLLKGNQAKKCWSKFGTFGVRMIVEVGSKTPDTALGVDHGTKFEGYSVVVGTENLLNVKLDLPGKKVIVKKLTERRILRRARRHRNCRRRPARFSNRSRKGFIAPSQSVVVGSRLKVIGEFFRIYPINLVAFEDVRFNHAKHRWGKNFSTVEIGKTKIKDYFRSKGAKVFEYRGFETQEIRKKYGYTKTSSKSADKFSAHCSDSLSLAVNVTTGERIKPGEFIVVNDTYRCKRRRLHDTQPSKGNVREAYSKGTVFGLRKGLLVGLKKNKVGQLCGELKGKYRYYDSEGTRGLVSKLVWISSNFFTRKDGASSVA